LLIWALIAWGPLTVLCLELASTASDITEASEAVLSDRRLGLLARSVLLAGIVASICSAIGLVAAHFSLTAGTRAVAWLAWSPLTLLLVPPYIHATVWLDIGSGLSGFCLASGWPCPSISGIAAAAWIQLMAYLPISIAFGLVGLAMTDRQQIETAKLCAGPSRIWTAIVWPQIRPAIGVGAGLVFVLSLSDYSLPALVRMESYALEAFVEYSIAAESRASLLVAMPLLALCLVVVVAMTAPLQRLTISPSSFDRVDRFRSHLPSIPPGVSALAAAICVAQLAAVVVLLMLDIRSLGTFISTVGLNRDELLVSLGVGMTSAMLSLAMALAVSPMLASRWLFVAVLVPFAVPATLVGIGLIKLWSVPPLDALYGTSAMPVLATVARFSALAVVITYVQSQRTDPALIEAARLFRGNGLATCVQIILPLRLPGLLAGFFGVFALSLSELTATNLVLPPGAQTVSLKIFSLLHYGGSAELAALSTLVAILCAGAMAVIVLALAGLGSRDHRTRGA
jgi:iron(III) transport system permease protein